MGLNGCPAAPLPLSVPRCDPNRVATEQSLSVLRLPCEAVRADARGDTYPNLCPNSSTSKNFQEIAVRLIDYRKLKALFTFTYFRILSTNYICPKINRSWILYPSISRFFSSSRETEMAGGDRGGYRMQVRQHRPQSPSHRDRLM